MSIPEQQHYDKILKEARMGESFLLVGTDVYWQDRYTEAVRKALRKNEVTLSILYGDVVKAYQLKDELDSLSLFADLKLIIIKSADAMNKKELDTLAAYFSSPIDTQSLVIQAEKIDARTGNWKKIKEACQFFQCDKPKFTGQIKDWVQQELRTRGISINNRALDSFTTRVELDFATAKNELDKLCLLVGERKTITELDVEKCLGSSRMGAQMDFFRAMGARKTDSCLNAVNLMLDSEQEPLSIVFMIQRFFTAIWKIRILKAKHVSRAEIIQKHLMDLYPSQRTEYPVMAENYSLVALETVFDVLLELDSQLKSISTDPKLLLSLALIKICQA